jgi:DnaJ family protein C protein 8
MRRFEALLGGVGEREIGEVLVGAILGILYISALDSYNLHPKMKSYKLRNGLVQLLHIHIVALPFLRRSLFLDLCRPRATRNSWSDHFKSASSLYAKSGEVNWAVAASSKIYRTRLKSCWSVRCLRGSTLNTIPTHSPASTPNSPVPRHLTAQPSSKHGRRRRGHHRRPRGRGQGVRQGTNHNLSILQYLRTTQLTLTQDAEIARILAVFRNDAYAVLDLQPGVPDSDIKKTYRNKSLLIHPDKTTNPQAPEAFDRLKKAQVVLLDEKERLKLDEAIGDARHILIREKKLTNSSEEVKSEEFKKEWREKTKWVIMDYEKDRERRVKAMMREEGRQQRKDEEELNERKRKREHDDAWEKSREARIGSWRDFQKGADKAKTKKKKVKSLG